eukprot:EG_transcript_18797
MTIFLCPRGFSGEGEVPQGLKPSIPRTFVSSHPHPMTKLDCGHGHHSEAVCLHPQLSGRRPRKPWWPHTTSTALHNNGSGTGTGVQTTLHFSQSVAGKQKATVGSFQMTGQWQ